MGIIFFDSRPVCYTAEEKGKLRWFGHNVVTAKGSMAKTTSHDKVEVERSRRRPTKQFKPCKLIVKE